jgi:hypothetical protein
MATGWPMKTTYANGDVYSASDVNDITGTINLLGSSVAYTAGKNKIINGDFGIWQRGTSFTSPGYSADRWNCNNGLMTSFSATRQTFTPGTAPVSGYEGTYYIDLAGTLSNASTGYNQFENRIEDVRVFAGQTVTLSFWAKGSTSGTINSVLSQNFGTGGTAGEFLTTPVNHSITTSWTRFSQTVTLPSISGKTVGTSSYLKVMIIKNMGTSYPTYGTANYTGTLSLWGVQLEQGSTATAFQTATGTIQGELAACQRYYYRMTPLTTGDSFFGTGFAASSTSGLFVVTFPVTMRKQPTALEQSGTAADYRIRYSTGTNACSSVPTFDAAEPFTAFVNFTVSSGLTTGQAIVGRSGNTSGYLGWSAEL